MNTNALFARLKRVAPATLVLASVAMASPADAQRKVPAAPAPSGSSDAAPAPEAAPAVVRRILVTGAQRVEAATILTYISLHEGDTYSESASDKALKSLFATGLFSDVKINFDGSIMTVEVVENPINEFSSFHSGTADFGKSADDAAPKKNFRRHGCPQRRGRIVQCLKPIDIRLQLGLLRICFLRSD